MGKEKTKAIEVRMVFASDDMFLAKDKRLYRYQIAEGSVKAYQKASASDVREEKIYNFTDNRDESDFWQIRKKLERVCFKKSDGSLVPVISSWGTRGGYYRPMVYGDLLFIVTNCEWVNTHPYCEIMEPTYEVLRAHADGSGYENITASTIPKGFRIVRISEYTLKNSIVVFLKSESNLAHSNRCHDREEIISYKRVYKTRLTEGIIWKEVELSENAKRSLLQAQK